MRNRKLVFVVLLLLWAMLIFFFSSQTFEEQSLSSLGRFDSPFWYELFKGISFMYGGKEVSVESVGVAGFLEFFIRKAAHFFIFFVFGFLTLGVWRVYVRNKVMSFIGAFVCVLLYAGGDELHQKFTGGRTPLVQDVLIDTVGGLLGLLFLLIFGGAAWHNRMSKR